MRKHLISPVNSDLYVPTTSIEHRRELRVGRAASVRSRPHPSSNKNPLYEAMNIRYMVVLRMQ